MGPLRALRRARAKERFPTFAWLLDHPEVGPVLERAGRWFRCPSVEETGDALEAAAWWKLRGGM